jgi:two-component system, OmpR family, sensor histidine kinase KdpD
MADGRAGSATPLELASAVAHELKSPLAAIRGAAAVLAREGSLADEDRTDLLRVIADASAQADRLVSELLLAGRLGTGRLAVDVREVDVAAIVESVAEGASAAREDVTVRTRFRGGVRPLTLADPDRLRAALQNLVDNAIAYAPAGRGIDVATSVERGRVRIAVTDEGPGIPADQRERIFEPYVRLSERTAGTGLGLHLARELARAMGGDVTLEPGDGPGATFVLALPTAPSGSGR